MRILQKFQGFGIVYTGTEWNIIHNLGYYPMVRVYTVVGDGNDLWEKKDEIIPLQVIHVSTNELRLVFSEAETGTVGLF